MELNHCPICEGDGLTERFEIRGYPILDCATCGGYSLGPQRNGYAPSTAADYDDTYLSRGKGATKLTGYFDYEGELALHLKNFKQYIALIRRHSNGSSLLDVGCASGHFLLAASQAGFEPVGLDVAAASTERALQRGFKVWTGDPAVFDLDERFDVVTLWETIEHLANPDAVLQKIHGWLKPNGLLVVGTGNNKSPLSKFLGKRWWYLNPPDHVVYYNPEALKIALERNGYTVERTYAILGHLVSSRNAIMKLLRTFQIAPAAALGIARSIPEIPIKVLHGTTMIAAARRREATPSKAR